MRGAYVELEIFRGEVRLGRDNLASREVGVRRIPEFNQSITILVLFHDGDRNRLLTMVTHANCSHFE